MVLSRKSLKISEINSAPNRSSSVRAHDAKEWTPPKYIIIWAQNPAAGCHDGFYGHWIIDCMKRGSKLITIDPRSTWFTTRSEVHLQNRPGPDGAIPLGMLNLIIK